MNLPTKQKLGARTMLDRFTSSRFYNWLNPENRFRSVDNLLGKLPGADKVKLP